MRQVPRVTELLDSLPPHQQKTLFSILTSACDQESFNRELRRHPDLLEAVQTATRYDMEIAHYEQALTVLTREADPERWAGTQQCLGSVYLDRMYG